MNAHRVDVLDGADDDDVVVKIPHHLQLELLPAEGALLQQHRADGALAQPALDDLPELLEGAGHAAALAPQRERGPHHHGEPQLRQRPLGLLKGGHQAPAQRRDARLPHRLLERLTVLGQLNGADVGPDQLDAVARQHPALGQRLREVQGRLPAHRRQQGVRPLPLENLFQALGGERLQVHPRRELGVGHDRGRVVVDQDHLEALLEQRLARLAARVVELPGLADHDRPRPDHQDPLEVLTLGHLPFPFASRRLASRRVASRRVVALLPPPRLVSPSVGWDKRRARLKLGLASARASARRSGRRGGSSRGGRARPPGGTARRRRGGACGPAPQSCRRSG